MSFENSEFEYQVSFTIQILEFTIALQIKIFKLDSEHFC